MARGAFVNESAATGYEVRRWLEPEQLRSVEYASYWNDEAIERGKHWWTVDGDFHELERYLDEMTTLGRQLADALALAAPVGVGADLAAGTLWAVPRLLAAGAEKVYAVEYSEHRLLRIGPHVLRHYGVAPHETVLCLGSFYALGLDDASLDFALLAQAFHHADDPDALLVELRRVLKPGGIVYLIGEHKPPLRLVLRQFAERLAVRARLQSPGPARRVLTDPVLGDHVYTRHDYGRMFRSTGFRVRSIRRHRGAVAFVLQAPLA